MCKRKITFSFVIVALFGLLISISLLIHSYTTGQSLLGMLGINSFKTKYALWGYSSFVFLFFGELNLMVGTYLYTFIDRQKKRSSFICFFCGSLSILCSCVLGLLFIIHEPIRVIWIYLSVVTLIIGWLTAMLSVLSTEEQISSHKILELIGNFLIFVGFFGILVSNFLKEGNI